MILLDTDTSIELIRKNPTTCNLRDAAEDSVVTVSSMTVGELFFGAGNSSHSEANKVRIEGFLSTVPVLETSPSIMRRFGLLKASLRKENNPLPDADLLIAATALDYGATLATGNTRHFARVPGLQVVDWIRPGEPPPCVHESTEPYIVHPRRKAAKKRRR